ncbi:MAG TPA: hypothetical protein VD835_16950 [Pyrinomonadaceae bacterium]|nr:hypothetical protein [Pyrinomonadaceae bacterium]
MTGRDSGVLRPHDSLSVRRVSLPRGQANGLDIRGHSDLMGVKSSAGSEVKHPRILTVQLMLHKGSMKD